MSTVNAHATIAFIGLGQMGNPMLAQLVKAGYTVHGCDLDAAAREKARKAGATVFESAREAAVGADVIITMLPNGKAVRRALLGDGGAITAQSNGVIVIDMSSSAPHDTVELGVELARHDVTLVDAPVSGGVRRAVDGALTVMAGGEGVGRVMPILEAMAGRVFCTGKLGTGHAMKALNNYVSGAGAVAAMEALIVGNEFGLDREVMVDILNVSTGRNNTTEVKLKPFVLSETWGSGFALKLMAKDIGIADDLAQTMGMTVGALSSTARLWKEADDAMEADADHTEIYRFLADRARN